MPARHRLIDPDTVLHRYDMTVAHQASVTAGLGAHQIGTSPATR